MTPERDDPAAGLRVPGGLVGLTSDEARAALARFGPNRWVKRDRFARLREAVALLLDPMAIMLAAAAIVYLLLGETRDAIVLALALIPVLGVDVVLEARSRAALDQLARAAAPFAQVVRDGLVVSVPVEDVVPGDLLVLEEGHVIAADGEVRVTANLSVDESSLTGESEPQPKRESDRFFAGSLVASGHGFGLVTTTGVATQYGAVAALVGQVSTDASPLQRHAGALVRRLGVVAVLVAAGLFVLGISRGEPWTVALLGSVSLAMAAIPEEFPIVLTLFLSVGAWRLASRGMLVRRLAAVETLGATTVICTDKTGTLTRGEFQMTRHACLRADVDEETFLEAAILACERHPIDPMERAIVHYAAERGVHAAEVYDRWTLVRDYDFDPVGRHMSHVWRATNPAAGGSRATCRVSAKGALEGVLVHAEADAAVRRAIETANEAFAADGLRVLALATKAIEEPGADRAADERGLTVLGLLGFQDPMRPEVPDAVAECQQAGIRIVMITGDHLLTAHAIAARAGILHQDAAILTGADLAASAADRDVARDAARETAPQTEQAGRITRAAIFARISPQQKHLIVDTLKRAGAVVAMTGDGVNDAPALRRADIGIAMGRRGTDVARATADLVLLDDNFASIVHTVRQGRHIFQNIQRAFLYLIAFHIPIVVLAVAAPLLGLPLVLLPIHLVWLELIVHPVSAIVFQAEPATSDVMRQPPRDPEAPLLPRVSVVRSTMSGSLLALVTFALYWWTLPDVGEASARGLALVSMLAGYQVLMFVERFGLPGQVVDRLPRTRVFWGVWCASALSLVLILRVPAASALFRVVVPGWREVGLAVACGVVSVGWRLFQPSGGRVVKNDGN